jgi:hypothetical protein
VKGQSGDPGGRSAKSLPALSTDAPNETVVVTRTFATPVIGLGTFDIVPNHRDAGRPRLALATAGGGA